MFFTTIKQKLFFLKNHHRVFNNQSLKLCSSSDTDNIIPEEEAIFKKNPTVSSPEVSKLTDSAKTQFSGKKKKYCIKGKTDSL